MPCCSNVGVRCVRFQMSFFSSVFPAVFLHGMANARGKRPVYVWGSRRPWDEIQLQAWNAADNSAPQQVNECLLSPRYAL